MPIYGSHGNFSVKGYGVGTGEVFLYLTTTPAPASSKNYYPSGGVDYMSMRITSTCTLNVQGLGSLPVQTFITSGGNPGPSGNNPVAGSGGPGGQYRTTSFTLVGGSPQPVVIGGSGTASSIGPLSSAGGSSGGAGGGVATPGSAGVQNAYWTGSQQWYVGGGGGGNGPGQPVGSGGQGGGGPGTNGPLATGPSGQANTGGGGGGPGYAVGSGPPNNFTINYAPASSGGTGVVVLRGPAVRLR